MIANAMKLPAAGCLVLLAITCVVSRTRSDAAPAEVIGRANADSRRAEFMRALDAMRGRFFREDDAFLARSSTHVHVASLMAACEMRAWAWTADDRYLKSAVARMRRIVAKVDDIREADFFTPFPLAFAYRAADQAGAIDDGLRTAMEDFVARRFKPRDFGSLYNQTLIRACGLELAAQVWPQLPPAKAWHDYATTIAGLLGTIEDVPENAPTYNALDLVCVWLLADLLDSPDLAAKPGVAAMFRRYRDQVSPAGFLTPYGDSGAAPRPFSPDWPMHSAWAHFVAAFERAGREYRDPTCVWAAERMAAAGGRHMPLGSSYVDVEPLFYSSFAVEWMDAALPAQQPDLGSQVLTRRDETLVAAPDKLILARSRHPGEAFLMSDLYCRGAHGHVNQHGAVTYFEFRDVPLLTALGYNNREPAHANLVFVAPAERPFPLDPAGFAPDVWQEATLPTSRIPVHDESQPFLRRVDALNFRITAGRRGVEFTAADVRLTGGADGPIVLDDLRSASAWKGSPEVREEGLAWTVPMGVHFLEKRGFAREFDCRQCPLITFRWRLSNNDEQARPVILRIRSGDRSIDFHAHTAQLDPTLVSATVKDHDGIERGTLRYTGWFTSDTTLDREMALTRSGVLVVRDRLVPGPAADGLEAGPIWHLASTTAPTAGPHWFNSSGGRMELLVWFAPGPGRDLGRQAFDIWGKESQQVVFARESLHAGKAATFLTVLVPHGSDVDAATLGERLSVEPLPPTGHRVTIGHTGETIDF
jgi:hypothetical protein